MSAMSAMSAGARMARLEQTLSDQRSPMAHLAWQSQQRPGTQISEGPAAGNLIEGDTGGYASVERLHDRGHRNRDDLVAGLSHQP